MRPLSALLLLAALGCSGGGTPTLSTPGGVVASVNLSSSAATLAIGQTTTITATPVDASGKTLTGKTVSWSSSATTVATVSGGLVTAVSPGIAVITATADVRTAQATITVTSNCAVTPLALAVGEMHSLTGTERSSVCINGGASGSEYALIPFKGDTVFPTVPLAFSAAGTVASTTSPVMLGATAALPLASARAGGRDLRRQQAFEVARRVQERQVLTSLRQTARARPAGGMMQNIVGLPATPTVGTTVSMNINVNDACLNPSTRKARVSAVSKNAIILADTASPAGGFTDADYAAFATTFDTLIYPLDTAAFGVPTDIDNNGRIVIFFTPAVNALTPKGSTGGYIAGFYFSRDIYPVAAQSGLSACAGSNYAEMFYMPVVDPAQVYNQYFKSKDTVQTDAVGTLAHEMQHLINDTRRVYVNNAGWEDVWMDEGLAHLAEEMLYYRVTGLQPKGHLTLSAVTNSQVLLNAINAFQVGNLSNYYDYISAPEMHAPYSPNDSLETRGAIWSLLRYALDQSPSAPTTYTRALVNTTLWGMANFNAVFGTAIPGGLLAAQRQMAIANFTDNSGVTVDAKYTFLSWNFRSVLTGFGQFPLLTRALTPTKPAAFPIRGGGASYLRFGVGAGATGTITSSSGAAAVPATVELILIRTK